MLVAKRQGRRGTAVDLLPGIGRTVPLLFRRRQPLVLNNLTVHPPMTMTSKLSVMQGLLVHDREGYPVVFMVCQPSTRYYQVMTRANWMPAFIDEVI